MIGGWHDIFQRGEPLNYAGLQNAWAGRSAGAPMLPDQRVTGRYQLYMGPWYHGVFGGEELERLQLEWFDTWLRGEPTGMADTPTPLHLYELGGNRVLHTTSWPLPHAVPQQWFLGNGRSGTATHSLNDGTLGPARPVEGEDTIAFSGASDPCSAPSEQWSGGLLALTLRSAGAAGDPCVDDDRASQAAPFALTYTSTPFPAQVMLGGPIGATIFATSTATDCEWVVDVEDVAPDGSSRPLTEGALLGSMRSLDPDRGWPAPGGGLLLPVHRLTAASPMPVTPNELTRYDVEVLPTLASIGAGHRLRVTITTSDTPHLLPNAGQLANLVGGVYRVVHNPALASFVELPIAPEGNP
jgi:uncharacterized protein